MKRGLIQDKKNGGNQSLQAILIDRRWDWNCDGTNSEKNPTWEFYIAIEYVGLWYPW